MAPSTTKAIVIKGAGKPAIEEVPVPKLRDGYILVRTTAVALNPTDWKHIDGYGGDVNGTRSGCDYAGVVEAIGPNVTKDFKVGDRVCGVVHGANSRHPDDGAWAGYISAKAGVQIKNPVTDEEGATLGIGICTVGQGLYQTLKLPLPSSPTSTPFPILIYGGSTATGILGIQFAKASGLQVIATASARNHDYLKSIGADAVFDYNSPTAIDDIRAYTKNNLKYVWDTISEDATKAFCAKTMSAEGGHYANILPTKPDDETIMAINDKIRVNSTLMYSYFGEDVFKFGTEMKANKEDYEFGAMFWELTRKLMAEGKVKAAKPIVNRGGKGLEGVLVGCDELRNNKVSGGKLVYTL